MTYHNALAAAVSLDGEWDFTLGPQTRWSKIQVPGCWESQGFSKHIDGPARYRRAIVLPRSMQGSRIFLDFDAVSHACTILVNGKPVGEHVGMWTPFSIDVSQALEREKENTIELEVWKPGIRYPVRQSLAGFLPDVATTFGGIWQSCRLRALANAFADLSCIADPSSGEIRVRAVAEAFENAPSGEITIEARFGGSRVAERALPVPADGRIDVGIALPDVTPWEPSRPALYDVRLEWRRSGSVVAAETRRVGFRALAAEGSRLLLNGKPVLLRGVLSWGWDPRIIAPLYDRQKAHAEIARIREMGFNLLKLCLFIPNNTLFDVADEEGMLLWEELPLWLPEMTPELAERAPREYAEYARIIREHPSVVLYTLGCEMGANVTPDLLGALDRAVRPQVPGALVCGNSGSGESYGGWDTDVSDFTDYHPYYDLQWFEPLLDNWRRDWKAPRPWIFGEFCDQDGFRDLVELAAANGGTKPWWMTEDLPIAAWRPEARAIVEADARLAAARPGFPVAEIVRAANAQALVTRKYTVESLRRRCGMGGYVITGLRDTPIATSGVFDDLDRPKWKAEEFRAFNNDAALCLEVPRRRSWTHGGDRPSRIDHHCCWAGDTVSWSIVLSPSGEEIPAGSVLKWSLAGPGGTVAASGSEELRQTLPPGNPRFLATLTCALPALQRAEQLRLSARLSGPTFGTANSWPIWVYPRPGDLPENVFLYDPSFALYEKADGTPFGRRVESISDCPTSSVIVATTWDDALRSHIARGGRVLVWQQGTGSFPSVRGPFWREAIKLFPEHPVWKDFPHQGYADMQFFGLATDIMLDAVGLGALLPGAPEVQPIMRRLDARTFAMHEYLVEAHVGKGAMLATTLRFQGGIGAQPSGFMRNVAGHVLFRSLLRYLADSHGS